MGQRGSCLPILREGRLLVAMRPAPEELPVVLRPAHEGAEGLQREGLGELRHELGAVLIEQHPSQVVGQAPAGWRQGRHALRREPGLQGAPVVRMRGWVHSVRNGKVPGRAAVRLRVSEHIDDVLMAEQRPVQEVAVGNRTALAHLVVRGPLVPEHALIAGIPVCRRSVTHEFISGASACGWCVRRSRSHAVSN